MGTSEKGSPRISKKAFKEKLVMGKELTDGQSRELLDLLGRYRCVILVENFMWSRVEWNTPCNLKKMQPQ